MYAIWLSYSAKFFILLIGIMVIFPGDALSQQIETCVGCHTSDKTLKMLYKPVKIESAEAEG
ncbi:MAG: hypothetical protein N3D15_09805 [Syntrophorhabdaceae bacterium]|nr:hypothetical protein [Syntrophorhabdaceae bacterium]